MWVRNSQTSVTLFRRAHTFSPSRGSYECCIYLSRYGVSRREEERDIQSHKWYYRHCLKGEECEWELDAVGRVLFMITRAALAPGVEWERRGEVTHLIYLLQAPYWTSDKKNIEELAANDAKVLDDAVLASILIINMDQTLAWHDDEQRKTDTGSRHELDYFIRFWLPGNSPRIGMQKL